MIIELFCKKSFSYPYYLLLVVKTTEVGYISLPPFDVPLSLPGVDGKNNSGYSPRFSALLGFCFSFSGLFYTGRLKSNFISSNEAFLSLM
jgi:hypothetical protein